MLRATLITLALALTAACTAPPPAAPPSAQATAAMACEQKGGTLRPVGRMQTLQCVVRYSDAGKACTTGEQCQGDCRMPVEQPPPEGAPAAGVCQATSDRFGCYTTVQNGRAEPTICVD